MNIIQISITARRIEKRIVGLLKNKTNEEREEWIVEKCRGWEKEKMVGDLPKGEPVVYVALCGNLCEVENIRGEIGGINSHRMFIVYRDPKG
jgi:hypothetical protein